MNSPKKTYVICTTARSGSNLFCDYARNTRVLGRPIEAFNPDVIRSSRYIKNAETNSEVSTRDYIDWILSNQQSSNGIFGTKILFEDFQSFKNFDRFYQLISSSTLIFLRRRNKLKQAVSYFFAEETGQWVHSDKSLKDISDISFNYERIETHLLRLQEQDTSWLTYFNGLELSYTEIFIEDFVATPKDYLLTLCALLAFTPPADFPIMTALKEQKNNKTLEFVDLFRSKFESSLLIHADSVDYKNMRLVP